MFHGPEGQFLQQNPIDTSGNKVHAHWSMLKIYYHQQKQVSTNTWSWRRLWGGGTILVVFNLIDQPVEDELRPIILVKPQNVIQSHIQFGSSNILACRAQKTNKVVQDASMMNYSLCWPICVTPSSVVNDMPPLPIRNCRFRVASTAGEGSVGIGISVWRKRSIILT